jgi:signal transduction histidine kinase/PAS domain-containing protein
VHYPTQNKHKKWLAHFRKPKGIHQDMTEAEHIFEALMFEGDLLLSIFESLDKVVCVTDPETYEILYANRKMKTVFEKELVGKICYKALQDRDAPCDFCTNDIIVEQKPNPYRWEHYNPLVDRQFAVTDRIIKWADDQDVKLTLAIDITNNQLADAAMQDHVRELEWFNRLAAGRETRVIELKQEVNALREAAGKKIRYKVKGKGKNPDLFDLPSVKSNAEKDGDSNIAIGDIIKIPRIQTLLDNFCDAMGIASAIIDREGNVIVGSHWRQTCMDIRCVNEDSRQTCTESDTCHAEKISGGKRYSLYRCHNGLTDAAVPIRVHGRHVANAYVGQFFTEPPDELLFRDLAAASGIPEKTYLDAMQKIPVVSMASLSSILEFLSGFAELIGNLSIEHREQQRLSAALDMRTRELKMQRFIALSLAEDAQQEREKTAHHAEELSRSNAELDDFAYIVSHDLKEPLRSIHSFSSFLLEDYRDQLGKDGQSHLDIVMRSAKRMESLLDDLRIYSRFGRTELAVKPTDPGKLVMKVLADMRPLLEEKNVNVDVAEDMPTVTCDYVRIGVVFRNLIENAIKYNTAEKKRIEVGWMPTDDSGSHGPVFFVRDNGIGIREKHLENIFKIFKRLHGRDKFGGGTGAGLPIVRKIVERHGGRIWAESEFGKSSTFYFTLSSSLKKAVL